MLGVRVVLAAVTVQRDIVLELEIALVAALLRELLERRRRGLFFPRRRGVLQHVLVDPALERAAVKAPKVAAKRASVSHSCEEGGAYLCL